jgi:hypothetical protein
MHNVMHRYSEPGDARGRKLCKASLTGMGFRFERLRKGLRSQHCLAELWYGVKGLEKARYEGRSARR